MSLSTSTDPVHSRGHLEAVQLDVELLKLLHNLVGGHLVKLADMVQNLRMIALVFIPKMDIMSPSLSNRVAFIKQRDLIIAVHRSEYVASRTIVQFKDQILSLGDPLCVIITEIHRPALCEAVMPRYSGIMPRAVSMRPALPDGNGWTANIIANIKRLIFQHPFPHRSVTRRGLDQ